MPEMTPVTSSLIAAVGYDDEPEELYIQFHKGGTYIYHGVSRPVYDALMEAQSIGHFFLRNIKANYECTKESSGPSRQT